MPNYLVVSTSGNPDSNSRRMGQAAFDWLKKAKVNCEWLDISKLDLPMCDADACYNHPAAKNITAAIERADGIMVATPVYNYDVSAAAKNMVELTGSAWEDKVVGFLCAAGGISVVLLSRASFMPPAILSTAKDSPTQKSPNELDKLRPSLCE